MIHDPNTPRVQREFLGWEKPALPKAAELLVNRYADKDGADLRKVVVVTPAARAGRRLGELLLDEAGRRGVPLTPPQTVTIGRFPELLYRSERVPADPATVRVVFARALRSMPPNVLNQVFPNRPGTLSGWMALAKVVASLHRELGAEGLDFRRVGRAFGSGFPFDDSPRWEVLAQVQDRYLKVLEEVERADLDTERRRALEKGRVSSPGDVWLVGVVEMPRVVRSMVEAISGSATALVHAPEGLHDHFDSLGCVAPPRWEGVHIPLDEDRIRVVQRPGDQADAVADILRGFDGEYAAEEVVVGVPDPELVPYLERKLAMVGVPHRYAEGNPVEYTGPVRLLRALGEYLEDRSFPAFASLIRHPDLHDLVERTLANAGVESVEVTGALTVADRYQAKHLQLSAEGPLPGESREAGLMRRLVPLLEDALGLERLDKSRPLSEWAGEILGLLVRVYGGDGLDRSRRRDREKLGAMEHIKSGAVHLAGLTGPLNETAPASEAVGVLLGEITGSDKSIPPDPEEHAVELLGWLELPLDDAPAVVVTGVNDRLLPQSMGADPFLPGRLRTYLGLPDDTTRYARDAYLLSALLHSRREVGLVAGRLTAGGDPLRPSRLLFSAPNDVVARRVLSFLGEEKLKERGRSGGAPAASDPPSSSRFHSPPEDPLPGLESLTQIRVTDFGRYLADPYRFALSRLMRLDPLDDAAREMDPLLFGNLAHLVLERFGKSPEANVSDRDLIGKKLNRLLDGAVHERFGRRPVPAVLVQAEQLRTRLQDFARWQAEWIADGWRVVGVESSPDDGVPFEVDGESVSLRGKIDRLDHHPEREEWAVFDYKTTDSGRSPEQAHQKGRGAGKKWVDLQLPLYRVLLAGIRREDGSLVVPEEQQKGVRLGYILLPKRAGAAGGVLARWTEEDLLEAEEVARYVIRALRAGDFPYVRKPYPYREDPHASLLGLKELPVGDDPDEGGEP